MPHQLESIQTMIHSQLRGGWGKRTQIVVFCESTHEFRFFLSFFCLPCWRNNMRKSHSFDFINLLKQKIEFLWMLCILQRDREKRSDGDAHAVSPAAFVYKSNSHSFPQRLMAFNCQSHPLIAMKCLISHQQAL